MNKNFLATAAALLAAMPAAADAPDGPETWHELGKGLLRDDIFTTFYFVDPVEFEVNIQESDQVPGRLRLVDAYANYPRQSSNALLDHEHAFVIDASDPAHVYIEKGCIGFNYSGADGWEYVIWSQAENEYNNVWGDWESVERECGVIWGTMEDLTITFPQMCLLTHIYQGPTSENPDAPWTMPNDGWRYANTNGKFRLKLPAAPDYNMAAENMGTTGVGTDVTLDFQLTVGADVAWAQYGMCAGEEASALEAELRAGGGQRADASAADMFGRWQVSLPYQGDGTFTFMAVAYNAEGVSKDVDSLKVTYHLDESEWVKCGEAIYTEAVMCSNDLTIMYGWDLGYEETYGVQVEVSRKEPGLVRLVNPYGPPYSMASNSTYDFSHNYYLVFDASHPDAVRVLRTTEGMGLDIGYGQMYFWSRADRSVVRDGVHPDDVWMEGTAGNLDLATGLITMPEDSMLIEFQVALGQVYWANRNGHMRVELPARALEQLTNSVAGIEAATEGERWWTIDGTPCAAAPAQPGLYIVARGGKTAKVLVK